jgi:hypothetical protein
MLGHLDATDEAHQREAAQEAERRHQVSQGRASGEQARQTLTGEALALFIRESGDASDKAAAADDDLGAAYHAAAYMAAGGF